MCTGVEIASLAMAAIGTAKSLSSAKSAGGQQSSGAAPALQTPARSATVRKEDTGAQVRIGADAASKARRVSEGSTDSTVTKRKTASTGLNLNSGTGAQI